MPEDHIKARVVLEDGAIFRGFSFTGGGESEGEVVFNTSLTGYQEILTDPSYRGQIVAMTYPLIGNYGINKEDLESLNPKLAGFLVKECSRIPSNWRSSMALPAYLKENNILGIEGVDTRALTRHIRIRGAMKAVISTSDKKDQDLIKQAKESKSIIGQDLVKEVTSDKPYFWNDSGKHTIVVLDCGVKLSILRKLKEFGCKILVMPAKSSSEEILSKNPDGVLISNGPGDPQAVSYLVKAVKGLLGKVPLFGICLGNQILGLAQGAKTYKLKFGHHGGNHPVKDLRTGKISITVQNHGFGLSFDSLDRDKIEVTHVNLNDNSIEGIFHKHIPLFSVQFHPEAGPGPHDGHYLFSDFIKMVEDFKTAKT